MVQVLGTDPGDGIHGYGTTIAGSVHGAIGMVTSVSLSGINADSIDITTMNTPQKWRRFIAGLKNAADLTFDLVYEKVNLDLILDLVGGANEVWTIHFPDGSAFTCNGFVQSLGTTIPMEEKITQSVTIKLSGVPAFNPSSP